jgi:hypothetical protein
MTSKAKSRRERRKTQKRLYKERIGHAGVPEERSAGRSNWQPGATCVPPKSPPTQSRGRRYLKAAQALPPSPLPPSPVPSLASSDATNFHGPHRFEFIMHKMRSDLGPNRRTHFTQRNSRVVEWMNTGIRVQELQTPASQVPPSNAFTKVPMRRPLFTEVEVVPETP